MWPVAFVLGCATPAVPFGLFGPDGILVEMMQPYWLSWTVALAVFGWACVPRREVAAPRRGVRGGADSTYFVAVLFWALQTVMRAHESVHWGHFSTEPAMPWKLQAVLAASATLTVLLCMALVSERVAGRRGHSVRAAGLSIPVPTVAAIASGFGMWFLVMGLLAWR
jgi:hypothetical protein